MTTTEHVLLALLMVLGVIWIGGGVIIVLADYLDARRTQRLQKTRRRAADDRGAET